MKVMCMATSTQRRKQWNLWQPWQITSC